MLDLFITIQKLINGAVPVLMSLGLVYFVWGVVMYVIADGEEAKTKGRDHIIYGIIGFAVIMGMWGLVGFVGRTFGISANGQYASMPQFATTSTQAQTNACQVLDNSSTVQTAIGYIICIIQNSIIPLLFALAMAFFLWGVIQFVILGAGDENKRTQGREHMIWGVIALTVMVSVWSLVGLLGGTFFKGTQILPGVRPPGDTGTRR